MSAPALAALREARAYIEDRHSDISNRVWRHEEKKEANAFDGIDDCMGNGDGASILALIDEALSEAAQGATIEPAAVAARPDHDGQVRLSMAISLMRIADAMTGGANFLTAPINSYGEGIGDAIQGQMVRGAAGIRQYER